MSSNKKDNLSDFSDSDVKVTSKSKKAPAKVYESPSDSEDEASAKPVASKKTSKASGSKTVGFDADISLDPFNDTNEKSSIQDNIV
ncbi:hypothetical protein IW146_006638, partial [Coemansia sp. RSA 922]